MVERQKDLSDYRITEADDSLKVAAHCLKEAVLALSTVDFKRHKDVMGYFNKEYVAKDVFPREIGRKLGTLQRLREKSDYDDFYIASREKAEEQFQTAELVINSVKEYLSSKFAE